MQVNLIRNTLQSNQDGRPIIKPLKVEFLAVAGGGGGQQHQTSIGDLPEFGYGGGAGGVITGSFCAEKFTNYPIVVGGGGAPANTFNDLLANAQNGEDTTLFTVTAIGGGGGGNDGGNGGSGGGGKTTAGIGLQPTASYSGFGNDGGNLDFGAGGGGAGTTSSGLDGGDGIQLDFTGTSVYYGGGGAGANFNTGSVEGTGSIGKGGNGGFGQSSGTQTPIAATSGSNGIVVIKYFGGPKATGGTITESSGVTYHTFESGSVVNFVVTKNDDNFAKNNCNDGTTV